MNVVKKIINVDPLSKTDNKLKVSLRIYGLALLVLAVFTIFKMIAGNYGLYTKYNQPVKEGLAAANSLGKAFLILCTLVIIHPFVEELSFRLWLTINKNRFFLGIAFCIVFFTLIITDFNRLVPISPEISFDLYFFSLGFALAYILGQIFPRYMKLPSIYILIIISSVLFALFHLNVVGKQITLLGYMIILLPYFISGYLYGYINYRIGFRYALFVHGLHNLTLACVTLLIK